MTLATPCIMPHCEEPDDQQLDISVGPESPLVTLPQFTREPQEDPETPPRFARQPQQGLETPPRVAWLLQRDPETPEKVVRLPSPRVQSVVAAFHLDEPLLLGRETRKTWRPGRRLGRHTSDPTPAAHAA